MRKKSRLDVRLITAILIGCFTVFIGCSKGPTLGSVDGRISLDGQPLPRVLITFIPDGVGQHAHIRSMGMSDDAGHFTLRTEGQLDGAVIGTHRVTVEDLAIYNAPRTADGTVKSLPPQRFPPVYTDPVQTPLQVTVVEAGQQITLELNSR